MRTDRRRLLGQLGSALCVSAAPSLLSGCATPDLGRSGGRARRSTVALLLPLTGRSAGVARDMDDAARLALPDGDGKLLLRSFDTGDTPAGAAAAAAQAVAAGAAMILGPVFAAQVKPAAFAAAGRAPLIAFTNDLGQLASGAFVFGVTASQSTSAVLQYARARGVRRAGLVGDASLWSRQAAFAARRLQAELGLRLFEAGTPHGLRAAAGGELPEAVLLTQGGAAFLAAAAPFKGSGTQLLGTALALDGLPDDDRSVDGAWFAAPDPYGFDAFAGSFAAVHRRRPQRLAALAHDAARVARALAAPTVPDLSTRALVAAAGFPGVAGAVRFRLNNSCIRELAIVTREEGRPRVIGRRAGA